MGTRTLWVVVVVSGMFLFSGCKGCKKEGGEQPATEPVAAEPQKQPDGPNPPAPADDSAEAADAGEPKPVVRHTTIQMPAVKPEEMRHSSFPKNVTPQARKAIIMLKKLQETDPRFKKSTGVPADPPIEETGIKKGKKRPKKRNK